MFRALGVAVAPSQVLRAPEEAVRVPFPVAVKLLSGTVTHKTELGGVVLDVADQDGVAAAVARIRGAVAARGARADAFLVQSMRRGVGEAVVGYRVDPEAGPLVTVGAGGRLTEIYRDVALRLAPVDVATARDMIAEVKGFAALRGFRGLPEGDLEALAAAVSAVSMLALAADAGVLEAEVNPLLVGAPGEGVFAVDAVVVVAQAGDRPGGAA